MHDIVQKSYKIVEKINATNWNHRKIENRENYLQAVKNLQDNEVFDERFIKILNESINRDIKDTEGYRTVQVFIRGSEHIPPEPEKIPNLMMYYIYNIRKANNKQERLKGG